MTRLKAQTPQPTLGLGVRYKWFQAPTQFTNKSDKNWVVCVGMDVRSSGFVGDTIIVTSLAPGLVIDAFAFEITNKFIGSGATPTSVSSFYQDLVGATSNIRSMTALPHKLLVPPGGQIQSNSGNAYSMSLIQCATLDDALALL